jgi:haloacetate dehalogenase
MNGFRNQDVPTTDSNVHVAVAGHGQPILLLHGFPESHLMWHEIGLRLAAGHTVVCADLPGYGRSGCPPSAPDHGPHAKRAMAAELVTVMERLGHTRFSVAGHDRGGRVAYRLALDHPGRIERVAVLDIVPTEPTWAWADDRFALGYWPWSLLAQPEPLPEQVLAGAAEAVVEAALATWGTPRSTFPGDHVAAYVSTLRDPTRAHAICEEYRAGATIDREHDRADQAAGRRIRCPLLALWSAAGPLGSWYDAAGGPAALWREWADQVEAGAVEGGHFFPEEQPDATAARLARFFGGSGQ